MSRAIDKKMLDLIEILKEKEVIRFKREFYDVADIKEQNVRNIRMGINNAHFRPQHMVNICKVYNVNANWIFGLSTNIFNQIRLNKKVLKKVLNK